MKINPSKTEFNRGEDLKFMKSRRNQNHARKILEDIAKERTWSRAGFLNEARRRGFLKTPIDAQIVKDVLAKMSFGHKGEYKERKRYDPEKLKTMLSDPDKYIEEKQLERYK